MLQHRIRHRRARVEQPRRQFPQGRSTSSPTSTIFGDAPLGRDADQATPAGCSAFATCTVSPSMVWKIVRAPSPGRSCSINICATVALPKKPTTFNVTSPVFSTPCGTQEGTTAKSPAPRTWTD